MKPLSIATLSALFSMRSPQEKQEKQSENATGGDTPAADAFSDFIDAPGESSASPLLGDGSPASRQGLRWADAQVADGLEAELALPAGGGKPAPDAVASGAAAKVSPSESVLNWRNSLRAAIEGEGQMPPAAEAPLLAAEEPAPAAETPEPSAPHWTVSDEAAPNGAPVLSADMSAAPQTASDDTDVEAENVDGPVERRIGSLTERATDQAEAAIPMGLALSSAQPASKPAPAEEPRAFEPAIRRARWSFGTEPPLSAPHREPGAAPMAEVALNTGSAESSASTLAAATKAEPQVAPVADESLPGAPDRAALAQPTPAQWPLGVWRARSASTQDTSGGQAAETAKPLGRISWVTKDQLNTASQMSLPSGQDPADISTTLQGEAVLKPVAANPASSAPTPFVDTAQPAEAPVAVDVRGENTPETEATSTAMIEADAESAPELGAGHGPEGMTGETDTMAAAPPSSDAAPLQADAPEPMALRRADASETEAFEAFEADNDHGETAPTSPEKVSATPADAALRDPANDLSVGPRPLGNGEVGSEELRTDRGITSATSSAAAQRTGATQGFGHQVADALVNAPNRAVELTLSPEELGKVRMTLHAHEGSMTVAVQAERPETLDLMRRHIDSLARDFREMGYADVSFDFGQQSNQQPKPQEQLAEAPRPQERSPSGPFQSAAITAPDEAGDASGGLDLRM